MVERGASPGEGEMDPKLSSATGRNIRRIRTLRGLSVKEAAELAGITAPHLSRIELGRRPVDRRTLLFSIANALQVSPAELTSAPLNDLHLNKNQADGAVRLVHTALHDALVGASDGVRQSHEQLSARIDSIGRARQDCDYRELGRALPQLIADLHTSISYGKSDQELLKLVAPLHVLGTQTFLHGMRVPDDLCLTAASLAKNAAERLDDPVSLGLAAFGLHGTLLFSGSLHAAAVTLARAPTSTGDEQLDGMLTLSAGMLASVSSRTAEAEAALMQAQELASRTGEGNRHYMAFGPTNVKLWEQSLVLETGDYEKTAILSREIELGRIPVASRKARYWINYGRAQACIRSQRGNAVRSLRAAESVSPDTFRHDPFVQTTLLELRRRTLSEAESRELRGMLHRVGLER